MPIFFLSSCVYIYVCICMICIINLFIVTIFFFSLFLPFIFYYFLKFYLFIYLWLHWVFIAACELFRVVASLVVEHGL